MAIRTVIREGDEALRKTSRPVEKFDRRLWTLLDDMGDTMEEENGCGLAAVQVGMLRRLFVIDVGEGVTEFINPQILLREGSQTGPEGCLSCPGQWGVVTRPGHIRIRAQDRGGIWFEKEGDGLFARACCHEYDHLDGRLFLDIAEHMMSDEEIEQMEKDAEAGREAPEAGREKTE